MARVEFYLGFYTCCNVFYMCLAFSDFFFLKFLQMEPDAGDETKRVTWGSDGKTNGAAASSYPDVIMDEDQGVRLSPLGRYQVSDTLLSVAFKKFSLKRPECAYICTLVAQWMKYV